MANLIENANTAAELINDYRSIVDGTATDIIIPEGITTIARSVFYESPIQNIVIPESVVSIGYGAFSSSKLTKVELPDSITSIGSYAFSYCNNISPRCIYFSKQLQSIGMYGFYNSSITDIYYEGTQAEWSAVQIDIEGLPNWYGYPFEPHGYRIAVHYNSTREDANSSS